MSAGGAHAMSAVRDRMKASPRGGGTPPEALTHLLDLGERGLAVKATRICSVDGCDRPAKGKRDWCGKHTERWRRWGDPTETHPRIRSVCCVEGCERLNEAHGMCSLHYRRWRLHGDPHANYTGRRARKPELDRLMSHVDQSGGPDACWPWTACRTDGGYGHTRIERNGRPVGTNAHRAIYQLLHGDLPSNVFVRHDCNNPPCCNPRHLRPGSQVENMADRKSHGAGYAKGGESPSAISVSDETVAAVRAAYRPGVKGRGQHAIAGQFGLSRTTVQRIVTGTDRWAEESV